LCQRDSWPVLGARRWSLKAEAEHDRRGFWHEGGEDLKMDAIELKHGTHASRDKHLCTNVSTKSNLFKWIEGGKHFTLTIYRMPDVPYP